MQVILKEDVVNLGYKDDIVTVKDGYGRNFLIPQGKAVIASESAKKVLAENKWNKLRFADKYPPEVNIEGWQKIVREVLAKADLSIEMGFACPCLPLGFLVSAETGLHTILIGIGRISGATNEKAVCGAPKSQHG